MPSTSYDKGMVGDSGRFGVGGKNDEKMMDILKMSFRMKGRNKEMEGSVGVKA